MILTLELEEKLKAIAEHHVNIFILPRVEKKQGPTPRHEEIHFIYPVTAIAGNAVDGNSLVSMQRVVSETIDRRVGTMWVGIHGDYFHIWASYRDE